MEYIDGARCNKQSMQGLIRSKIRGFIITVTLLESNLKRATIIKRAVEVAGMPLALLPTFSKALLI